MNKLLSRLLCGVGFLSAGVLTAATTPPVTVSTPLVQLNWTLSSIQSLQLPKFDPTLGTLQSVKISVDFGGVGDLAFENLDNGPRNVSIDTSVYLRMFNAANVVILQPTGVAPTVNDNLPSFDLAADYMGPSSLLRPNLAFTAPTGILEYTAPADDLSPYIGPGTIP